MTIKEIAQLADVSISTVSKIMNGKDDSIGKETREKVLKIAKENNYAPYSNLMSVTNTKKFIIGVLLEGSREDSGLLTAINGYANENGYSVLYCQHGGSEEEELKAVDRLCRQNVDGVIWKRTGEKSHTYKKQFDGKKIPVYYSDYVGEWNKNGNYALDYGRLGYDMAAYLIERQHQKLGCLYTEDEKTAGRFAKGFQRCLYDHHVEYMESLSRVWHPEFVLNEFMLYQMTGVVCFNEEIAADVLRKAAINSYKVPEDLSVFALGSGELGNVLRPKLTTFMVPTAELGRFLCKKLIQKIETNKTDRLEFLPSASIGEGDSVDVVSVYKRKKIVVVGSINMDAVVNVEEFAETGETVIAENFSNLPGGKGSNQAVGTAKLGAEVHLIGKVGKDYEAKVLKDAMFRNRVGIEGVSETAMAGTGKAYITVQKNGESSVIVYQGANKLLTNEDILQHRQIFKGASFCLLQLETPVKTAEYAAGIAVKEGAKVILKPAAAKEISDSFLRKIEIFVPNEKELHLLMPGQESLEKKAQHFLDRGVKHVIVTLGRRGCYLKNQDLSLYVSAADFKAVDTTGAADAFISALAVFRAEGFDMVLAIKYATYAAGLSVSRQGVQPSLADRLGLEVYGDEIDHNIKTSPVDCF